MPTLSVTAFGMLRGGKKRRVNVMGRGGTAYQGSSFNRVGGSHVITMGTTGAPVRRAIWAARGQRH